MTVTVTLILGGARSGKSWWAERLAVNSGRPVRFIATAMASDDEMAERIAAHRALRPASWHTVESTKDLANTLRSNVELGDVVVVDCLTLWVTNVMLAGVDADADVEHVPAGRWSAIERELVDAASDLVATARSAEASLILVSNEVGLGLVPPYPLGRVFRDILGRVNQVVAHHADSVVLMVAGLPVDLRRLVPDEFRAILDEGIDS